MHAADQERREPAGGKAKQTAANNLAQQRGEYHAVAERNGPTLNDSKREQEQDHAGAIVKQAFADNRGAQPRRQTHLLQQVFDDDCVGRRRGSRPAQNTMPAGR